MSPRSTLALLLLLAAPASAAAAEASFIIVNPAGRGNQSQAEGFLADFARALESAWPDDAGPCPAWSGHYHVHQADALASIRGRRPLLGLLSPGFHLAVGEQLGAEPRLVPVLASGSASRMHLVVLDGSPAQAALAAGSVAGLRVGGQAAGEPAWTRRVLLQGLAGAESVALRPQARSLRAVRALRGGDVDAVLLGDDEWARLAESGLADGLAVARTVEDLLPGPLALLDAGEPERRALAEAAVRAVARFDETEAGRAVLERMGLRGFAPVDGDGYHRLAALLSGDAETVDAP